MPRAKSKTRTELVDNALMTFWKNGYHVVSMKDLVQETGVSRGGIYTDFAGKRELFHACLQRYQETVVTPAFARVEAEGAGLSAIRDYLEHLIARVDDSPQANLGCLVGNTLAQIDKNETDTLKFLEQHNQRITAGFCAAISRENQAKKHLDASQVEELASFASISVRGLWVVSRGASDSTMLRQYCETLLACLQARIHGS